MAGLAEGAVRCGWLLLLVSVFACSSPVSVRRVPAVDVHRALTANVLSTGEPSPASIQVLHRRDLFDLHRRAPDEALRELREVMLGASEPSDLLFALAELEFLRGDQQTRGQARPHFVAAALYAFHFLSASSAGDLALDPRARLAADLYNRGLTSGLATDDGAYVDLSSRTVPLPFGSLTLTSDPADLDWGGYRMARFVPVAELEVRGLRSRYRRPGIGAPLAASLDPPAGRDAPPGASRISRLVRVPATAVVHFEEDAGLLDGDVVRGRIELIALDAATTVSAGERVVPLESEPTAALAFGLSEARPWELDRRAFLWGDFGSPDRGVRMLAPYDPARIPVVFIHGTASSPWRWAEMINSLQADPALFTRYQFWLFQYNTAPPIPFSAGLLRQDLSELVAELDPEGDDHNLRRIVLVGHSQGGLVAKLCVVEAGDGFWKLVSEAPVDELDLRPETRAIIERSLFFEPLPFVERVVFIATPHRGSFLAERWFSRLAARIASLPGDAIDALGDLIVTDGDRVVMRNLGEIPSSIDQMRTDDRFLQALADAPIAVGVKTHSIVAVSHENEDPARAHDGVVTLESQRLAEVDSELVVRSGHSTQRHPLTIAEVARILRHASEQSARDGASGR